MVSLLELNGWLPLLEDYIRLKTSSKVGVLQDNAYISNHPLPSIILATISIIISILKNVKSQHRQNRNERGTPYWRSSRIWPMYTRRSRGRVYETGFWDALREADVKLIRRVYLYEIFFCGIRFKTLARTLGNSTNAWVRCLLETCKNWWSVLSEI